MFCLVIFFTGSVSGFVIESFDSLSKSVGQLYHFSIRPLIMLLPQFDKFSPSKYLIDARYLSWSALLNIFAIMIGIKAVLLVLLSLVIFKFKEIAKIVV